MVDYERRREIEKCVNCSSENLIGPYNYKYAYLQISLTKSVHLKAFVCVDCHHTMLFVRDKHKPKILEEAKKRG